MKDLTLTRAAFNSNPYFTTQVDIADTDIRHDECMFDQSGYELMPVELEFAHCNGYSTIGHAIRQPWFTQPHKEEGAILNHAYLLGRKGFSGPARQQLTKWAERFPCYYRYLNMRPKWGLDLSIDFFDHSGRTFEVIHWEFDSFDFEEIEEQKMLVESVIIQTDFDLFAEFVWREREQWYDLDYAAQTSWRCKHLGIIPDRWKMVVW
jgi:hypothetical protein